MKILLIQLFSVVDEVGFSINLFCSSFVIFLLSFKILDFDIILERDAWALFESLHQQNFLLIGNF